MCNDQPTTINFADPAKNWLDGYAHFGLPLCKSLDVANFDVEIRITHEGAHVLVDDALHHLTEYLSKRILFSLRGFHGYDLCEGFGIQSPAISTKQLLHSNK